MENRCWTYAGVREIAGSVDDGKLIFFWIWFLSLLGLDGCGLDDGSCWQWNFSFW
jgi:hypothetical protein